jgi:hypothetical protein
MRYRHRYRYTDDWNEIALSIKERANWRCSKCGMRCIRPGDDVSELTRSERMARRLQVHHWNRNPDDNRLDNLSALCVGCHLSYHYLGHSNISPGQLSLFEG